MSPGHWRGVQPLGNCPAWPIPMGCGPYEAQANGSVSTRGRGGLDAKQGVYVPNAVVPQQGTQYTIVFENDSSMTGVRMSEGTARKLYAELRIAGYGRDANGQLEGDLGHGRGAGRDEAEDLRGGDRVPVVGVVEQEPRAGRAGHQDQVPAAGEKAPHPQLAPRPPRRLP